jgi:hypothetical protein
VNTLGPSIVFLFDPVKVLLSLPMLERTLAHSIETTDNLDSARIEPIVIGALRRYCRRSY